MFSAYRLDQYPDPDGFMLQALAVLSEYPAEVVHYVTDPRTGLQRTQTFPPTISEIAKACDAKLSAIQRQKDLDAWHERKARSDELRAQGIRRETTEIAGAITYKQFLEHCEQTGQKPRPVGRFEQAAEP